MYGHSEEEPNDGDEIIHLFILSNKINILKMYEVKQTLTNKSTTKRTTEQTQRTQETKMSPRSETNIFVRERKKNCHDSFI